MKPLIFQIWTHGTPFQKVTVIVRYTPHQVGSSYRRANLKLVIISHKETHSHHFFDSTWPKYFIRIDSQKDNKLAKMPSAPRWGIRCDFWSHQTLRGMDCPTDSVDQSVCWGFPKNFGCPSLGKNRMSYVALQNASFLLESVFRRVVETRSTSF